ncbi:uncharacterized protein BDR25DRAFT_300542 [Lindgomyces ingoldianus]|uniref:Uncharacterized protein n=1 Tax=Lindgomyces ingoldianus TaxID=673940 RepID=A0ACB6RB91_9PLEO|nr:uncharacterized protein BDR25DRAFT_300542 [Lindgomyces ingoldianus]KAF2476598.1 hypothetical protein BDR25DRAFT_300542 [Lindgomyces ingoldianus]
MAASAANELPVRTAPAADTTKMDAPKHSVLNSTFPVLLPQDDLLFMPEPEFQSSIRKLVAQGEPAEDEPILIENSTSSSGFPSSPSKRRALADAENPRPKKSAFMNGLFQDAAHQMTAEDLAAQNKTLTANADVTNISSKNPLVDLFYDLAEFTADDKLKILLEHAWKEDSLMTLKIIFNTRSIHLGKSNKIATYKAMGWLAENHPLTLLASLKWLVRPIIEKRAPKPEQRETAKDEDFAMVEVDGANSENPEKAHDVRFGVSHGYWKDLLNLVALAANNELKFNGNPESVLSQHPDKSASGKRKREWDPANAKVLRTQKKLERHDRVLRKLEDDGFYRALHTTVARLFASQLKEDAANLASGEKADMKKLSLAAKWAPTFGEFHDKHTFILSSIAEILFPKPEEVCPDATNRELYLRYAREVYRRKIGSPLRKALSVVEREIASNNFEAIHYDRVPSLAMDRYTKLFLRKDFDHFSRFVNKVAEGSVNISGATLLPSTLVSKARVAVYHTSDEAKNLAAVKANAQASITRKVIDGQWKTLVQRVRDSGVLESSIGVCDVSGSMGHPVFKDNTCPMDSSIGLSLLLAEVTAPPFGGAFISFSESPTVVSVGGEYDKRGLVDKVAAISRAPWGYNTNFTAVFEDLILPMAVKAGLKQEEMVKQVFVFSDMQFDEADEHTNRWTTSFDRIKAKFEAAGYEMPRLIFWNLASKSSDKPTTMDDINTALVSGYSQGMLKVFLDGGGFEGEGEEEITEEEMEDEDGVVQVKKEKKKMDPLTVVKKAVSHKAYSMLNVVD